MLYKVALAEGNSLNASHILLQIKCTYVKKNEVVTEAAVKLCLEEESSIITLGRALSFVSTIRKIKKKIRKNCKRGEVRK